MFCSKCGNKLKDDEVFCGNCGTRSREENSTETTLNYQQHGSVNFAEMTNINKEVTAEKFNKVFRIIKPMLITPTSSIKGIVNEIDKTTLIIFNVSLAIIQGLLFTWFFNESVSVISKKLSSLISGFGGSLLEGLIDVKEFLKIPYGQIFIQGAVLFLITVGILYLGIYIVVNTIFKSNTNVLDIAKVAALITIPTLVGEILFLLVVYISLPLAIVVFVIGIFISFSTLVIGTTNLINLHDDKVTFGVSITYTVMLASVIFLIYQFVLMDIDSIKNSVVNSFIK